MPERVTTRGVGSPSAESTRFPGEGQSAQGQSGPKARPKGVADGQRANIPAPDGEVEPEMTPGQGVSGVIDAPVPQGRRHFDPEVRRNPGHEKLSGDEPS